MLALGGRVESFDLSSLAEDQVISLTFETPEVLSGSSASSLGGINDKSGFAISGQAS